MCDLCQLQFSIDHDTPAAGSVPCPNCGRFYVDPEQRSCYHCFAEESALEACDQCRESGRKRSVPLA